MTAAMTAAAVLSHYRYERLRLSFTTLHNVQTRQLSPTTRCAGPDRRRFSTNTTAAAAAAAAAAMTAAKPAAAVLSHYRYERLRLSFCCKRHSAAAALCH